jgi:hypothetical protein
MGMGVQERGRFSRIENVLSIEWQKGSPQTFKVLSPQDNPEGERAVYFEDRRTLDYDPAVEILTMIYPNRSPYR